MTATSTSGLDRNGAAPPSPTSAGLLGVEPRTGPMLVEPVEHPLTPEDVAMLLRIDRETVYRMARRGELPGFKVSSRWRFLPSRLQRWMEEQAPQRR